MKDKILVLGGSEERDNFVMSLIPLGCEVVKCSTIEYALKKLSESEAVISFRHVPKDSFGNIGDGSQVYIKAKELGKVAVLIEEGGYGEVIKDEIFTTGDKGWQQATREAVDSLLRKLRERRILEEEHDLPLFTKKKIAREEKKKRKLEV